MSLTDEEVTYRKNIDDKLDLILVQTTKTNGKVANLTQWKDMTVGALSILTVIVLPALAWVALQVVNLPEEINSALAQTLQNYSVNVQK